MIMKHLHGNGPRSRRTAWILHMSTRACTRRHTHQHTHSCCTDIHLNQQTVHVTCASSDHIRLKMAFSISSQITLHTRSEAAESLKESSPHEKSSISSVQLISSSGLIGFDTSNLSLGPVPHFWISIYPFPIWTDSPLDMERDCCGLWKNLGLTMVWGWGKRRRRSRSLSNDSNVNDSSIQCTCKVIDS